MNKEFSVVSDCAHLGSCPRKHIPGEFCSCDALPNFNDTPDCPNFLCKSLEENLAYFMTASKETVRENFVLKDITLSNGKKINVIATREDGSVATSTDVYESKNRAVVDESGQTYLPMTSKLGVYHPNRLLGRTIFPYDKMVEIVKKIFIFLKDNE